MIWRIAAAALALGLPGCSLTEGFPYVGPELEVSETGEASGSAFDGAAMAASITAPAEDQRLLSVERAGGWSCTGAFPQTPMAARIDVPLACGDGVEGFASLQLDEMGRGRSVAVKRDDGTGGVADFPAPAPADA